MGIFRLLIGLHIMVLSCGCDAICIEREVDLDRVPQHVLKVATNAVDGIVIREAEIVGEGAEMLYELEGQARGIDYEILLTPNGTLISVEEDD